MIRPYDHQDAEALCAIYNSYVEEGIYTLDLKPMTLKGFQAKCKSISQKFPFLVYEDKGQLLAYAYGNEWKIKKGYRYTLESTIYVSPHAIGKGIGTQLYRALLKSIKKKGFKNVVACLTLPNAASVALHENMGFIKVAHFQNIAEKFDKQVDVGYWQLLLH